MGNGEGNSYRVVLNKNQIVVVSETVAFGELCTEKGTGLDDGQKFMELVLEAKHGNATVDVNNDEHLAHNSESQLPDLTINEERNVMRPVDSEEQNTEPTQLIDGGDEYSNIDMENITYYANV